jgi:hypothetical protein
MHAEMDRHGIIVGVAECEIGRGWNDGNLVSFACSFAPGEEGEARGSNNCSPPACLPVWKGIYRCKLCILSVLSIIQPVKKV